MKIVTFVARRLVGMIAILLVVSFLVFCLLSLAPGDPAITLLGGPSKATPEAIAQVRALYHLDEPLLAQYWYWLQGVMRFDFGRSISSQLPVGDAIGVSVRPGRDHRHPTRESLQNHIRGGIVPCRVDHRIRSA